MKTLLLAAVLVTAIGCKKSDNASGGAAGDAGCSAAIGKAVDAMMSGRMGAGPTAGMDSVATKLRATLTARCTEDKWPEAVISCFTGASDFNSIKKCEQGLTPEQNQKRQQEVMKVMMSGQGGGQMGDHGMGGPPAPAGN